jgi:hypothetical protein
MGSSAPAEGDVVDVVPRGLGVRAILAPAGHPAVDDPRVAGEAVLRAEAEPLGDPGPEPLHDDVGLFHQPEHGLDPIRVLEVDADGAPVAGEHVLRRVGRVAAAHGRRPLDADDVGAHVAEEHGAERAGPDPGELDDLHPVQRPHAVLPVRRTPPCRAGRRRRKPTGRPVAGASRRGR